jgi:hypothetical protein
VRIPNNSSSLARGSPSKSDRLRRISLCSEHVDNLGAYTASRWLRQQCNTKVTWSWVSRWFTMVFWGMKRSVRYDVVSSIFALAAACFGTELFLYFSYFNSHPAAPNGALGLIHALNNHGSYVYLSDTEWVGLSLLRMVFFACVVSTYVILPKDPTLAPPDTPRWIAHSFYVAKTNMVNPPPRLKTIFLCSVVFYLAVIYLAGPLIAHLFASHRIILEM